MTDPLKDAKRNAPEGQEISDEVYARRVINENSFIARARAAKAVLRIMEQDT